MHARRITVGLLGVITACSNAGSTPAGSRAKNATASEPSEDYRRFGMPEIDRAWTAKDYGLARDALSRIESTEPARLPMQTGPGAVVFAKIASVEHASMLASSLEPLATATEIGDSLRSISQIYLEQYRRGAPVHVEYIRLCAVVLGVSSVALLRTAKSLTLADLREDPARLASLVETRYAIYSMVLSLMDPGLSPAVVCEQLAEVITPVARLLSSSERAEILGLVEALANEAALHHVGVIRFALDSGPTNSFVRDFAAEHAAFAASMPASPTTRAAVKLEAEGDWFRYADWTRRFSAAFPTVPIASEGTTPQRRVSRTLAAPTASGGHLSVTCFDRPSGKAQPSPWFRLHKFGARNIHEVEIAGRPAAWGLLRTDRSRSVWAFVDFEAGSCSLRASYPTELGFSVEREGERFVKSLRLGA